jgi:hypothetical protein
MEYVIVKYAFDTNVDDNRKAAFRIAAQKYHKDTCINVVEEGNIFDPSTFDVQVGIYDATMCSTQGMGNMKKNNPKGVSKVNLGWCLNLFQIGPMVHEIGHVLGMNHEQRRPDAIAEYFGHGPYLTMHWEHVEEKWKPEWVPDASSYTGSADDGAGDNHSGYAPYDFGSIMHYPVGKMATTIPAGIKTGQRARLSAGDIMQLKDVYQCKPNTGSPKPTPSPTPSPPPTPAPPCENIDSDRMCEFKLRSCTEGQYQQEMHEKCKKTCGFC